MTSLADKSVLITGGTGSFGMGFIELLMGSPVRTIRTYSRGEHRIESARKKFGVGRFDTRMGDIRDKGRLKIALRGIDVIVHAAALKQAPHGELEPTEFAKTNIQGTINLIECVLECPWVEKVLLISTDKAVQPINLYGASKMMAEKLIINANKLIGREKTVFSCTRYGNVATSQGTIVPVFQALPPQEPVPVTNRNATRFWLSLCQANKFVYDCLERMEGGEIFVPKIPSVKVIDIAEAICPARPIRIIGDRPGDKLHEALFSEYEHVTNCEDVFIVGEDGYSGETFTSDKNRFLSVEEIRESIVKRNKQTLQV